MEIIDIYGLSILNRLLESVAIVIIMVLFLTFVIIAAKEIRRL